MPTDQNLTKYLNNIMRVSDDTFHQGTRVLSPNILQPLHIQENRVEVNISDKDADKESVTLNDLEDLPSIIEELEQDFFTNFTPITPTIRSPNSPNFYKYLNNDNKQKSLPVEVMKSPVVKLKNKYWDHANNSTDQLSQDKDVEDPHQDETKEVPRQSIEASGANLSGKGCNYQKHTSQENTIGKLQDLSAHPNKMEVDKNRLPLKQNCEDPVQYANDTPFPLQATNKINFHLDIDQMQIMSPRNIPYIEQANKKSDGDILVEQMYKKSYKLFSSDAVKGSNESSTAQKTYQKHSKDINQNKKKMEVQKNLKAHEFKKVNKATDGKKKKSPIKIPVVKRAMVQESTLDKSTKNAKIIKKYCDPVQADIKIADEQECRKYDMHLRTFLNDSAEVQSFVEQNHPSKTDAEEIFQWLNINKDVQTTLRKSLLTSKLKFGYYLDVLCNLLKSQKGKKDRWRNMCTELNLTSSTIRKYRSLGKIANKYKKMHSLNMSIYVLYKNIHLIVQMLTYEDVSQFWF